MVQAEVEDGERPALTEDERSKLVRLRRENRVQAIKIEILERASAYFARENVLLKLGSGWPINSPTAVLLARCFAGS